jgi:glycopeptide antibiotics resistance protein
MIKRNLSAYRGLGWTGFIAYLLFLSYQLFFVAYGAYDRHAQEHLTWNLIPFSTLINYIRYIEHYGFTVWFVNLFGNIAAFIPFGFFAALLIRKCREKGRITLTISMLFSLLAEGLQATFKVGSFDVDDILLNSIGGLIGWSIATVLRRNYTGRS